jgi:basic membrane protein A and related proteins
MKFVAVAFVAAMALAACGTKATSTSSSSTAAGSSAAIGKALKACMVLDTGGVDDRSFNQSSWAGLQAANKINPKIAVSYIASNSQNDYTPNLTAEVSKGCDTVIAVGGLMSDAVKAAATQNPKQHFAQIDGASSGPNVYGMQYNTAQGGFLGGYLAAGMTKTGRVATYGGVNIPPVTVYMDGFWEGVQYYNKAKGKNVQVLGWDEKHQKGGTFAGGFSDANKSRSISQAFIQQGADIIFPVAGASGLGSGAAAQAAGGKVSVIWVDFDGCKSAQQYCKFFLSSVLKDLTGAVSKYATASADGTFPTGNYLGDLKNDGTGLAPFHEFDSKVSASLKTELDQIKADIISGKIVVTSPSQPK